jgi:DNA-sulfur modification-associated
MTTDMAANLDLSAGRYVKGIRVNKDTFLAVTSFNQLQGVMRNPRELQTAAKRSGYDAEALEEEAGIHELIQRALSGSKRSNVPSYAAYIREVVEGRRIGVLPPMHLWSAEPLAEVPLGQTTYLLIPDGTRLFAIDGETQLAAHFELHGSPEIRKAHGAYPLGAVIHHGISVQAARQYFHDLNLLAVRPSTSLGLAMDTIDPLMRVVAELEVKIPFLTGRVDKQARQLRKGSQKIITIHSLRQMTINVAKGIAGVQYGAKPAPLDDVDLKDVAEVARDWFTAYFETFAAQVIDREATLAGAAPVLAAVGAMGNQILHATDGNRSHKRDQLLASLQEVDWKKGEHWAGIAGKFTTRGTFSVGGTKEVAYSVYNVLSQPENPGFSRVRGSAAA